MIFLVNPEIHHILAIFSIPDILHIAGNFNIPYIPNISDILDIPEKIMGRCQIATKRHRPVSNSQKRTPPGVK